MDRRICFNFLSEMHSTDLEFKIQHAQQLHPLNRTEQRDTPFLHAKVGRNRLVWAVQGSFSNISCKQSVFFSKSFCKNSKRFFSCGATSRVARRKVTQTMLSEDSEAMH